MSSNPFPQHLLGMTRAPWWIPSLPSIFCLSGGLLGNALSLEAGPAVEAGSSLRQPKQRGFLGYQIPVVPVTDFGLLRG